MVRIAIALSVGMSLLKLHAVVLGAPRGLYRPVGIWMLLGHTPPPAWLVDVLWALAWAGTVAMLLGIASRASCAVSFVASVSLAALSFAATKTWSHQYNVVFLAQCAFLGARGGDALALDLLWRRPPENVNYQASLRLVQLAVALMFAGAAFHKILHGHFTLRWALSDNLRHQLLLRYDLAGLHRPPVVDWIIDDPWRYRTAAVLNLISQATPLAAVFLVKRPVLRAMAGLFFVVETIALGLVVDLWNWHWLPLYAVFVDWGGGGGGGAMSKRMNVFVIAFVTYEAITSFVPGLDQWLNTYPFSGFPMFATIRVRAPYDQHLPYDVAGDHFEVTSDVPIDRAAQTWFDHANRGMFEERDPARLEKRLRALLGKAQQRYPSFGIRGVRLVLTMFEAPPVPAPAHFEPHPIATVGEIAPDGAFRTMLGKKEGQLVWVAAEDTKDVAWTAQTDDGYVVSVQPDGTRWLVSSKSSWKWQ